MTWPTDLARRSTNPFSPENMITKNLTDQALKNERDRIARNTAERSSGSSSSSNESNVKSSKMDSYKFTPFTSGSGSAQSSFESSTSSRNSGNSNLSGRVSDSTKKNCSLL